MADTGSEPTIIGSDTHIKGEMSFKKTVRLVGTFEGSIRGEGELQVGKGAVCKAEVESGSVVVDGIVEGNLVARDRVQLNDAGVVKGDIVAGKMVMTEGASFFGKCAVGPDAVKAAGRSVPEAATASTAGARAAADASGAGQRPAAAAAAAADRTRTR